MVNAWKPILAAVVIFTAGVVTGALVSDVATPQPARAFPRNFSHDRNQHGAEHRHGSRIEGQLDWLMRRIQRDLKLTDEQTEKVEAAFKQSHEDMKLAFEELRPRLRASTEKLKNKLRGDLTEEQIEKFSKYLRPPNQRDRFKGGPGIRHSGARGDDRYRRGPRGREQRRSENKGKHTADPILDKPIN